MSRLDSIPPDLSAVLSLLLRRGKRYGEVAGMLGIEERAVHDRAHAALALLAPGQARGLSAAQREQLGEYLLGQQSAAAASQTRDLLASSPAGRAWAQALVGELAPLATTHPLPQIPDTHEARSRAASGRARTPARAAREPESPREPSSTREPPGARESVSSSPAAQDGSQPSSSRVGGAVILGALAAIAIVVVLVIVGVGGGGGGSQTGTQSGDAATTPAHHAGAGASSNAGKGTSSTPATSTNGTPASGGTSTGASSTSHGKALTLSPPDPATSKAIGVAYVLTQKTEHAFYVFAKGLPALPSGSFYAVWLEGATSAPDYPLGSLPSSGSSGLVEGGGPLPSSAGSYSRIIVTSETSHHPSHPGPTLLGGPFSLH
jgi:hypothetical protein